MTKVKELLISWRNSQNYWNRCSNENGDVARQLSNSFKDKADELEKAIKSDDKDLNTRLELNENKSKKLC